MGMKAMTSSLEFEEACVDAFRPMVDVFGFDEPKVERIGCESYVRYHCGAQTVSISFEDGMSPIVELFYPIEGTSERPVFWAERNGVARGRRIPRLIVKEKFSPGNLSAYLRAEQQALETNEADFRCAHV